VPDKVLKDVSKLEFDLAYLQKFIPFWHLEHWFSNFHGLWPPSKDCQHLYSSVTRGVRGGHLPPGAALWGRQIEVGMLRTEYEMSNVSGC